MNISEIFATMRFCSSRGGMPIGVYAKSSLHYKLQYLQRLGTLSKVRQVWYNETSIHTRI